MYIVPKLQRKPVGDSLLQVFVTRYWVVLCRYGDIGPDLSCFRTGKQQEWIPCTTIGESTYTHVLY